MKKLFTLFAIIMMASSMAFASGKINFHLTGCTSDANNPTSYTEDDEGGIELYFAPEEGYTLNDWEITVKHGSTVIPINNWSSPIGYAYPEANIGYLFIIWFDEITEDFDVTITCKKDAPAEPTATVTLFSNGQENVVEKGGEYSLYTLDAIQFSMDNLTSDMDFTYGLMDAEMNPLVFGQNVPVTATPHMDLTITPESPIVLNEGTTYVFVLQITDNAADEVAFATMCYIQGLTPATPTTLATLTAEVINNGTAVQVTSSDPDMYWTYRFIPYYEERDSAEFVASIDESIVQDNDFLEDMAWDIYSDNAKVGSQTADVPGWVEEGEELCFYAYGIANKGNGTVKRVSNVVFIPHFVYNATPTALENIATDAKSSKTSKLIKDGKLVIIKDGKKYNVVGQQM